MTMLIITMALALLGLALLSFALGYWIGADRNAHKQFDGGFHHEYPRVVTRIWSEDIKQKETRK